jgi:signal peptidase I
MKLWIPFAALALALSPLAVVHPVRVSGKSMEPTLIDGSLHLALRSWCAGTPVRGEVWLLEGPSGPVIKRVIGLPGDHLEQRDGELFLNGPRMDEPYVRRIDQGDAGPWEAGEGYLLLGDNRRESQDSRAWGALPRSAFLARIPLR